MSCDVLHARSNTNIVCWNVHRLGSLSDQCAPLQNVLATMEERNIDFLTLSESRWPGSDICNVCSRMIVHSGTPSSHVHGVAIILSPHAKSSWDAAGSIFHPISERMIL